MTRSLRALLASSVALLSLATAGCKQGDGERCQVGADCQDGLVCVLRAGGNPAEGGTCKPGSAADASANLDGPGSGDLTPGPDLLPEGDLPATPDQGPARDLLPPPDAGSDLKPDMPKPTDAAPGG